MFFLARWTATCTNTNFILDASVAPWSSAGVRKKINRMHRPEGKSVAMAAWSRDYILVVHVAGTMWWRKVFANLGPAMPAHVPTVPWQQICPWWVWREPTSVGWSRMSTRDFFNDFNIPAPLRLRCIFWDIKVAQGPLACRGMWWEVLQRGLGSLRRGSGSAAPRLSLFLPREHGLENPPRTHWRQT